MSTPRSKELWTVAYFLSRCGSRPNPSNPTEPPPQLKVHSWTGAYDLFYDTLGQKRTRFAFRNTLKNARDAFDGHLNSGRAGWREEDADRAPQPLGSGAAEVMNEWREKSDNDLWREVQDYLNPMLTQEAVDIAPPPAERIKVTTYRILRDTALARQVKQMHRYECQLCGQSILLRDGTRYAEAHHVQPLGAPHDGPDVIENILCVCPNHHAELDYTARRLLASAIRSAPGHVVHSVYIAYHNDRLLEEPVAQANGRRGPSAPPNDVEGLDDDGASSQLIVGDNTSASQS